MVVVAVVIVLQSRCSRSRVPFCRLSKSALLISAFFWLQSALRSTYKGKRMVDLRRGRFVLVASEVLLFPNACLSVVAVVVVDRLAAETMVAVVAELQLLL